MTETENLKAYGMNRKILKLALPNIISNITVPLLGMVDMAIIGHLGDASYIGAIAIGASVFNFIYWGFGFLRMGTSGLTAQAFGARDLTECMRVMARAMTIGLAVALLLLLLQVPLFSLSASLMNTSERAYPLVLQYFFIRVWAAPATLGLYVLKGWFIGMQNSRTPMWISILINVVNIVCSLLFVIVWKMDIAGVALGTVAAQYSGVAAFFFILKRYYGKVLRYSDFRGSFRLGEMRRFFNVNKDIFLRTLCLVVVFTFFTSASSKMGESVLAVNALLMQLFMLFSYIMDGFAYAAEAMVGRFYGARNRGLLNLCIRDILWWGVGLGTLFTLLYATALDPILSVFTDDASVIAAAAPYYGWIVAIPFAGFVAFIFDGVLIGMTETKLMRNVIFAATALFFGIYYTTVSGIGNNAIWLSLILFLLVRGGGQMFFFYRRVR